MFSRLRNSFQREAETDEQHKDSGRSYLNVRDFLDELEVRSTVSTAQSEIVESMRMSEAGNKRFKRRKHHVLNFFNFNQYQRKGESATFTRNSRAASMHALSDHNGFEPSPDPGKMLSSVSYQSSDWSNAANAVISFDTNLSSGSRDDRRPALINHHRGNYLTNPNMQKSRSTSILTQQTTKQHQVSAAPPGPQTRPSKRHNHHLLDLEILSAELQYKIEKYKLEMINLQQNIKRCKDTEISQDISLKRGTSFFSIMENIQQRSGRINSKVVTSLLKPHQLDLFEMSSDGVLVTKVDVLTGASLPIPDTLLEIEGRDALAMALGTWKVLSEELMDKGGEMRVVLIRQIENVESSLIRSSIEDMQRKLENKLGEARRAHSELRLVIRENLALEEANMRLSHRVQHLEDQCRGLRGGLVRIQNSLDGCLSSASQSCVTRDSRMRECRVSPGSGASSGVFSGSGTDTDSLSTATGGKQSPEMLKDNFVSCNMRSLEFQPSAVSSSLSRAPPPKPHRINTQHSLVNIDFARTNNPSKFPGYKLNTVRSRSSSHLQLNSNKNQMMV